MTPGIELSERQRERFEAVKQHATEDGRVPEPDDGLALKMLLDTWDAVNDGQQAGDRDE